MRYMASLNTVSQPDPSLLPAEMARFNELRAQGTLAETFLAHDRMRGWFVVNTDSPEAARQIVESLPFSRYWNIEITELLGG
jgi:muconolactone delta-isomerase